MNQEADKPWDRDDAQLQQQKFLIARLWPKLEYPTGQ